MIEIGDIPPLHDPVVIAAFEGWNDAAESATMLVDHLAQTWGAEPVMALDPEDYYDFQVNRPVVGVVEGERRITWPTTRVLVATETGLGRDVILIQGIEPSFRWRSFVIELLEFVAGCDAGLLVVLGGLLADVPHSRPFPVGVTSGNHDLVLTHDLEPSSYEGPTGIVGVLADAARQAEMPCLSAWVSVPHYAATTTSPKGALALLGAVEGLLGVSLPVGELPDLAKAWERGVDELAASDTEVAQWVQALEQAQDAADAPGASGDAIAAEFERYLRRRDDGRS